MLFWRYYWIIKIFLADSLDSKAYEIKKSFGRKARRSKYSRILDRMARTNYSEIFDRAVFGSGMIFRMIYFSLIIYYSGEYQIFYKDL